MAAPMAPDAPVPRATLSLKLSTLNESEQSVLHELLLRLLPTVAGKPYELG
jgi:hypothetical protein